MLNLQLHTLDRPARGASRFQSAGRIPWGSPVFLEGSVNTLRSPAHGAASGETPPSRAAPTKVPLYFEAESTNRSLSCE